MSVGYKIYVFHVVRGVWQNEDKDEMLIFYYNDKQNALIQENNLQVECQDVKCAKMPKK